MTIVDQETLTWYSADAPPDDSSTVLIYMPSACEPVWLGYIEDGVWNDVSGAELAHDVTAWAPMPVGCTAAKEGGK